MYAQRVERAAASHLVGVPGRPNKSVSRSAGRPQTAQEGVRTNGADLSLGAMGGRLCYRSERCHGRPFLSPSRCLFSW